MEQQLANQVTHSGEKPIWGAILCTLNEILADDCNVIVYENYANAAGGRPNQQIDMWAPVLAHFSNVEGRYVLSWGLHLGHGRTIPENNRMQEHDGQRYLWCAIEPGEETRSYYLCYRETKGKWREHIVTTMQQPHRFSVGKITFGQLLEEMIAQKVSFIVSPAATEISPGPDLMAKTVTISPEARSLLDVFASTVAQLKMTFRLQGGCVLISISDRGLRP